MDGLTGLRAIAAIWVVSFHYSLGQFRPLHLTAKFPVLHFGYLGVDLFFMLSGFVIWHVHAQDFQRPSVPKFKRFIMLRIARLYPVYFVTMLLFAVIFLLSTAISGWHLNPAGYRPGDFFIDLFLIQNWVTGHMDWNYPAWSVSAEWFCYFLFPLAALSLVGFGRLRTVLAALALILALAGIYVFVFGQTMNQAVGWASLVRALVEFLIGCLLRQMASHLDIARVSWTPLFLLLLAGTLLVFAIGNAMAAFMPVLLFPVLILGASTRDTLIGRIAAWRPFVVIGSASYSLYLMQAPVQKAMKSLKYYVTPEAPVRSVLIILGYIAVLTLCTFLIYRFVEQPMRRLLRRRLA